MHYRQPFVLITSQRTGSTLLVRSLDADSRVFCAGEILYEGDGIHHPEWQFLQRPLDSRGVGRIIDALSLGIPASRHVLRFYEIAGLDAEAVGFKLMISQLRGRPAILRSIVQQRVRRLFLVRQSVLSTALSQYSARVSHIYHGNTIRDSKGPIEVEADPIVFGDLVQSCWNDRKRVLEIYKRYGGHLLSYEDLVESWEVAIAAIGRFLGVDGLRVEKALPRLSGKAQTVRFLNVDSLRRQCERMLGESVSAICTGSNWE